MFFILIILGLISSRFILFATVYVYLCVSIWWSIIFFCDSCLCPALIISWVAWLARILYLQIRICVINRNKNYIGTLCVNLSFSFSLITPFLSCLIFNSALLKGYYIATYIYMFLAFFDNEIFFWRIQS